MSPPRKRRFAALSPQGAKKHLGRPGVFLVKTSAVLQGLTFATALLSVSVNAAECVARAETVSVPLVELYTSEGCSSCPPADRWLSQQVPGRFVPLALHVDYWDYIGWRDRFAQARFGQRQRDMVNRGGGRVVYTPQVMLSGVEMSAPSTTRCASAPASRFRRNSCWPWKTRRPTAGLPG